MSDTVSLKIKVDDDGSIKNVTVDTKEFADALDKVKKHTHDLNKERVDFAALVTGVEAVANQFSQIGQFIGDLSNAYSAQIEAETKLEQVMQNTMNATAADVQAIKELCSAQQELGVIGDEVQLAGAQELATYLEKRSSLEALIPVMNDMVAQQYGYNATQESAAQIATMMGKVMEGQVSALSRYGYSFTEAQAEILKFGTEEERAATLAEVVGQSVGGVNQALAQTPYGKFKQLANELGDMKEKVGAVAAKIQPFYTGLNSVVQTGAGIATVANGMKTFGISITSCTGAVKKLSAAVKAFCTGNPLLLALTAVVAVAGAVVAALHNDGEATEELKAQTEAYNSAVAEATAKMNSEIAGLKQIIDAHGDDKKAVEHLNEQYGDIFGTYQTAEEWYDRLIKKSKDYALAMGLEAKTKKMNEQLADLMVKKYEAEQRAAELAEKNGTARTESRMVYTPGVPGAGGGTAGYQTFKTDYGAEMDKVEEYDAAANKLAKDIDNLYSSLSELKKSLSNDGGGGTTAAESYDTICAAIQKAEKKLRGYNKTETEAIALKRAKIDRLKEQKTEYEKLLGLEPKKDETPEAKAGSLKYVEEQIREKKVEYEMALDPETRAKVKAELNELESQKRVIELEVTARMAGFSDTSSYISSLIDQMSDEDLELELKAEMDIDIPDLEPTLQTIQQRFAGLRRTLKGTNETLGASGELMGAVGDIFKASNGGVEDATSAWLNYGAAVAQSCGQMVAAILALIPAKEADAQQSKKNTTANVAEASSGFFAAHAEIPFVGIVLALAAVAGMVATIMSLPKFAKGGIAYGPTMGLFGEYPGAANNPEVVAPLSKLKSLLNTDSVTGGRVEFEIKGRRLVGVLAKENNVMARR